MIDPNVVPVLAATSSLLGGVGLWWHARRLRSRRRTSLADAAAARGWRHETWRDGYTLSGRTLSCPWTLHVDQHAGPQAVRFDLGAPDERRLMLRLGMGRPPGVLPHGQPWPAGTRPELADCFWMEAARAEDLARVLDPEMEAMLAEWQAACGCRASCRADLHAWLSPHGVMLRSGCRPADWAAVERTVRLGVALGRRAGLA